MSRFAKYRRVFFVEEPVFDGTASELRLQVCPETKVNVAVPTLPVGLRQDQVTASVRQLVESMMREQHIREYAAWFYTPMALSFAADLEPIVTIYDCMDELSAFRGAPPALIDFENDLFDRADLVFTGGLTLFEAKCERHKHVYPFPSSVDVPHFSKARAISEEPVDQRSIPHPRIGYAGVIDERIDIELIAELARKRPDWQIVMIGPVVKISQESLPRAMNLHYLGMKPYSDLPAYFSGWDAAMLPFALNDATRFISPTKTPEYLAAGLPVISTPIRDVVRPYGELGLAKIASTADEFAGFMDHMVTYSMGLKWRERADHFLSTLSWDTTWSAMNHLIVTAMEKRRAKFKPVRIPLSATVAAEAMDV